MSIKIPVAAELNQQDITAQIQKIEAALNDLGRVAQAAGRIQFNPISGTTLDQAKRIRAEFEAIQRLGPGLKRALEAGGQGGRPFEDIDWGKVWKSPEQRAGHAEAMLNRLSPGAAAAAATPPAAGGGGGGRRRPRSGASVDDEHDERVRPGGWRRYGASAIAGVAGGAASQLGGLAGGVASGAMTGGMVGGPLGAAIGGLTGGLSSAISSIGASRDLANALDTLKRTLGDTGISFEKLQANTRGLADEFSLTDADATALTSNYARLAGSDKDLPSLRSEVGVGVGFSRSFGLDPAAGVDFFGRMRGMGITKSTDDNKRLALLIGESVAKAGDLPRLGDVMSGLSRYMEGTAARSMTDGNAAAWLGKFAALERTGLTGSNATNNSNMVAKANDAVSRGGLSEAGRNFMLSQLQKDLGLNPIQADAMLEGGLFATGKSIFGEGSAMAAFYKKTGKAIPAAAASTRTNMDILMGAIERQYAGKDPDLMLDALKNTFGLSYAQGAAWESAGTMKIGGLMKRLGNLGLDPSKINSTGISRISQIEADKSLSEVQKDAMIKDVAGKNQEDTDGSRARQAEIDSANALGRLASEGLPMLSSMQAGILKMAGLDPMAPQRQALKAEHLDKLAAIDGKEGKARDEALKDYQDATPWAKRATGMGLDDNQTQLKERYEAANKELIEARKAEDARYNGADTALTNKMNDVLYPKLPSASTPSAGSDQAPAAPGVSTGPAGSVEATGLPASASGLTPEMLKRAAQSDALHGLPDGTTAGLMMQESGGRSSAVSRKGARGLFQIMPANVAEFSRRVGRQMDPTNTDDAFYMYDQLMGERDRKYGSDTVKKLRSYHGGYDETAWGSENADYVPAIERRKREITAREREINKMQIQVVQSGEFVLRDTGGQQLAVADIQTTVGPPIPNGAR